MAGYRTIPVHASKPHGLGLPRLGPFAFDNRVAEAWRCYCRRGLNLEPLAATYVQRRVSEAVMTHWRNTMVDRPETDGAIYVMGWTISGLAVLGAVVAVWVFGI